MDMFNISMDDTDRFETVNDDGFVSVTIRLKRKILNCQ